MKDMTLDPYCIGCREMELFEVIGDLLDSQFPLCLWCSEQEADSPVAAGQECFSTFEYGNDRRQFT